MSEIVTKPLTQEYYGMPGWGWIVLGGVTIAGGVWLGYEYFVYPGNLILDQYKAILGDIYGETKQFLDENEAQGIFGLTAGQEAIIDAKVEAAEYLRPQVQRIITERGEQLWSWVETVLIGIVLTFAIPYVADKLIGLIKKWRTQNPQASSSIQSQYGHLYYLFELVANEYAYAGKLGIASAFYNSNIPEIYMTYTQQGISVQTAYYGNLLTTLVPGTINYIVAQNMLNFLTYEASAVTGIMPLLHRWWLPPLI